MIPIDVAHCAAIAHDVALESPLFPQALLKKVCVGAARYPVYRVVHAHDRVRLAFHDGGPERRQVRIDLVIFAHPGVKHVPIRLWTAMHGVVLGCRDDLQVMGIVPLHARNERDAHAAGEIGIFSVGFLAASPTRIPEDVDVRRPVRQSCGAAGKDGGGCLTGMNQGVIVLGSRFGGNDVGHPVR